MTPAAKLSDESNKAEISIEKLSHQLQKSIKNIVEKENFTQYDIAVKDLSTDGDNYLGTLYEIDIKGKTSDREKEVNLFVKEKLIWKNITFVKTEELYANEEFMYKDLSKVMISLQNQANIPQENRFKIAVGYDETNNDAIILENVCKKGFERIQREEAGSLKFYQLGVQELAKFHALSFVIKNNMPEYFKEKIAVLETPFHFNDDFFQLMRKVCKYLANLYDDETKTKIENLVPVLMDELPKYQSDKTGICTISHCDYRKSNCMIRTNNGKLEDLMIVDYQIMDYGCPMRDLLLFLTCGLSEELKMKHLDDLKSLYFETLSRFLKYFDMDVEDVFPRKVFERISKERMKFAFIWFLYFSVFLYKTDEVLDMKNLTLKELPFHPEKDKEEIIRRIIDDYVKLGYF